jgi:hypothetical protein
MQDNITNYKLKNAVFWMLHRAALIGTDVSEQLSAYIIRVTSPCLDCTVEVWGLKPAAFVARKHGGGGGGGCGKLVGFITL